MDIWSFEKLEERPEIFKDLKGVEIELGDLEGDVRDDLAELIRYYNEQPPYPQFKTFWHAFDSPVSVHLDGQSPAAKKIFAIGRDLEKRLGIAQGRVRP